jgi:hypothetical protein
VAAFFNPPSDLANWGTEGRAEEAAHIPKIPLYFRKFNCFHVPQHVQNEQKYPTQSSLSVTSQVLFVLDSDK